MYQRKKMTQRIVGRFGGLMENDRSLVSWHGPLFWRA
jgi:hypothetical protein